MNQTEQMREQEHYLLNRLRKNHAWLIRDGFTTSANNLDEAITEITKLSHRVKELEQALAAEPAKLVRLTEEDVHRLAEEFGDKFEDSYIFNADGCFSVESFAHAIMDALEAKNGGKVCDQ